uniref:Uncharacterized protein n=1 Tax=Arundo donax TaxID=35708 RepID=A0A0A9C727_ARUDO
MRKSLTCKSMDLCTSYYLLLDPSTFFEEETQDSFILPGRSESLLSATASVTATTASL